MNDRIWIPAAFLFDEGMLLLHEPVHADRRALVASLLEFDYPKPFVFDNGVVRRLHFSPMYVQSEMVIRVPNDLSLAYTRKMMAFMLFMSAPRHILVVGLGGGSLTKYCYHHLPTTRITTVEINSEVIAFSDLFEVPPQGARHTLVQGDAVDYVASMTDRVDIVLIDGCDKHGIAPTFCDDAFYREIRARLEPDGLLVMNLVGPTDARRANLRMIASAFGARLLVQEVSIDGNQIVFAFNNTAYQPNWPLIERKAAWLARHHGLDFGRLAQKLRRTHQGPQRAPW
ncbi:hypothetical protein [Nannocystis sp.]|nr:hypothetical protein [Nannocystis sp.]MBK7829058.1 spermidine synthase [Nannocystis sp.]